MRETSTKSVNNAIKICIWGKGLESVPPSLSRVLKPSWILSISYSPTYKTIYSKHFCEPCINRSKVNLTYHILLMRDVAQSFRVGPLGPFFFDFGRPFKPSRAPENVTNPFT